MKLFFRHFMLAVPYGLVGVAGFQEMLGGEWGASGVAMVWHLVSDGVSMARDQLAARRESRRVGEIIVHPAPGASAFFPEGGALHVEEILGPSRGTPQFGARAEIGLASDARREREPPLGTVINEADLSVEARPSVKYEGLNRDSPVGTGLPSTGFGTEFSSPPGRKGSVERNFRVKYQDSYGVYFREKILTLSVLQSLSPDQALEVVLIVSRKLEESFGNELFKESLPEFSPNERLDLLVLQSRALLSYLNIAPKVSPPLAQRVARWLITSAHSNTPFSVDVLGALLRTNLDSVEPESLQLLGYYFPVHAEGTIPDVGIQQRVMAKFTVNNVSTARAARGFMETMGWNDASVIIGYAGEMDQSSARKHFPSALVEADRVSPPRDLPHIRFSDGETMVPLRESESFRWLVPIAPFKSVLPEVPFSRVEEIRGQLRAGNRKIFVIGSPAGRKEAEESLRAIWRLSQLPPISEPPLILIAPNRESDLPFIINLFKDKTFIVRRNENDKFPDMSKADVLIVLSKGELLDLYATGDVSIVGTDRNIMEPASQGKPVFFFNAVPWEKNITAMELLWNEGGALPFDGDSFVRVLQNGQTLLEMGKRAKDTDQKMKSLARDRAVEFGISYSFKQILKIRGKHLTLRFRRGGDSESHSSTQEMAATWVVSKGVGYAVALMGIAGGMAVLGVPWTVIFENPVRAGLIGVGLIPFSSFLASTAYIAALLEARMLHRDLEKWILWHGVAAGTQEYDTLREVGLKLREIGRQQGLLAELHAHNKNNLRFFRARFLSFWNGLNVNRDSPAGTGLPSTGFGTEFSSPPGRKGSVERNFRVNQKNSFARSFPPTRSGKFCSPHCRRWPRCNRGIPVNEDDRLAEAIYKWMPMSRGPGPRSLRRAVTLAVTNPQVDLGAVAQSIVRVVSGRSVLSTGKGAENWTLAGLGVNTKAKALIPLTTELLHRDDLPDMAQKALLLHPAGLVFFIPSGSELPDLFKKYLEEKESSAMLVEADLFVNNSLRMAEVENKTPRSVRDVTPYVPEGIAVNYEGVRDVSRFGEKAVRPLGLLYSFGRILRLIKFIAHFA